MESKKKFKESNPDALYLNKPENNIPHSIGSLRQNHFDIFSPRGDHAKDAFDQLLNGALNECEDEIDW